MIDLTPHIEYLLMNHDCVVVPGLGAFLVHETPSFYDSEACRFMPPSRSLGFNQALTINDGLLVESVARKRGLTLDSARVEVESVVASFRHQLMAVGSLSLGSLGVMTCKDDTLIFEPSSSSAVTMRYAGLMPLAVSPLVEESNEADDRIAVVGRREVSVPVPLKIAASVIIILVACGVFFTADSLIGNRQTNYASLDSGLRAQVDYPVMSADESGLAVSREIELNIAAPRQESIAEIAPSASAPVIETQKPSAPGRYLLVVGSFPAMKQALKHIGGDSRLAVMEMDGKYRVYAASAATNAEAHAKADALREEFPSVWICRR